MISSWFRGRTSDGRPVPSDDAPAERRPDPGPLVFESRAGAVLGHVLARIPAADAAA